MPSKSCCFRKETVYGVRYGKIWKKTRKHVNPDLDKYVICARLSFFFIKKIMQNIFITPQSGRIPNPVFWKVNYNDIIFSIILNFVFSVELNRVNIKNADFTIDVFISF